MFFAFYPQYEHIAAEVDLYDGVLFDIFEQLYGSLLIGQIDTVSYTLCISDLSRLPDMKCQVFRPYQSQGQFACVK